MGKYVFKKHSLPTTKSCPLIKPADTSSCATPSGVSSEWKWLASQKNTNAPLCSNNNKLTQCWVSYLSCNESQATHNLWTILNAVEQSKKEFQALHCSSAISSNLIANVPTITLMFHQAGLPYKLKLNHKGLTLFFFETEDWEQELILIRHCCKYFRQSLLIDGNILLTFSGGKIKSDIIQFFLGIPV